MIVFVLFVDVVVVLVGQVTRSFLTDTSLDSDELLHTLGVTGHPQCNIFIHKTGTARNNTINKTWIHIVKHSIELICIRRTIKTNCGLLSFEEQIGYSDSLFVHRRQIDSVLRLDLS